MARIKSRKKLNGWAVGVFFRDGVAETDNLAALAYYRKAAGFKVTDAPAPDVAETEADDDGDS